MSEATKARGGAVVRGLAAGLAVLAVMAAASACGWTRAPAQAPAPARPPVPFLPACAEIPVGLKMELLSLSERVPHAGATLVIGPCRGQCGVVLYVGEGRPMPEIPAAVEGERVCVEAGSPPKQAKQAKQASPGG